jgi:hypothetical protein
VPDPLRKIGHAWAEALHPRDKHGRFIHKGENVELPDGSVGEVVGSRVGTEGPRVLVHRDNGSVVTVDADKTSVTSPTSTGEALKRSQARQESWRAAQAATPTDPGVHSRQVGGFRVTTVDGVPEVYFKEVLELDKRPPEQYREVATDAQNVLKNYPGAIEHNPLEIGWSNELDHEVMADTNQMPPHKIRLNVSMWDSPDDTMAQIKDMQTRHFGVTAETEDLVTFRANVLTHEIGHVLHLREQDQEAGAAGVALRPELRGALPFGQIDKFANEEVTPRQLGWQASGPGLPSIDSSVPRWQADTLNFQSTYATTDPFEFFAEAFLDGTINGDKASESGKRAVALARTIGQRGRPT